MELRRNTTISITHRRTRWLPTQSLAVAHVPSFGRFVGMEYFNQSMSHNTQVLYRHPMYITSRLLALTILLAGSRYVNCELICFFNKKGCDPLDPTLCCNGEMKPGECCGIDNPKWCKDMPGEDLPLTHQINFFNTNKAVGSIRTSTPRNNGKRCLEYGRFSSPPRLQQCSARYGEADRSAGTNILDRPDLLGRASASEASNEQKCWEPDHVRWTTANGVTMMGHINEKNVKGGLQKIMMVLNGGDAQILDGEAKRIYDGGEKDLAKDLLDDVCRYGDVMNAPVHQEEFESEQTELQDVD